MLTRGWVADGEAGSGADGAQLVEKEQAVAGGLRVEDVVELCDGVEPVAVGGGPRVEGEDIVALDTADPRVVAGENGKAGLVVVVGEEEIAGGGDAAPGAADGAAAEEGFSGEADEDLPDDDLVREAGEERRRISHRHDRCSQRNEGKTCHCGSVD
jgi:hypothetical protein